MKWVRKCLFLFCFLEELVSWHYFLFSYFVHTCWTPSGPAALGRRRLLILTGAGDWTAVPHSQHTQFVCWAPHPQCNGVRRWDLGGWWGHKGGAPRNGTAALRRETHSTPLFLPPREDTVRKRCLWASNWTISRPQICQHLHLRLLSLQNREEYKLVLISRLPLITRSAMFCDGGARGLWPQDDQLMWSFLGELW